MRGGGAFAFLAWFVVTAVSGVMGCSGSSAERSVVGVDSQAAAIEASSDAGIEADGSGDAGNLGAIDDLEDGAAGEASSPPDSGTQISNDEDIDVDADAADLGSDASEPEIDAPDSDVSDAATVAAVGMAQPCTAISPTGSVLFDLGHVNGINFLWQSGDRILSEDSGGHWVLWDVTHRSQIVSGDIDSSSGSGPSLVLPPGSAGSSPQLLAVDMVGTTVAIPSATSIVLLSATDGHTLHTIALGTGIDANYGLASDGSYVWVVSTSSLEAWSTAGKVLVNRQGNYFNSSIFAAPTQLQVGQSPVADLELVSTVNGSSKVALKTNSLGNAFGSWFLDGSHFFSISEQLDTPTGTSTITMYSSAGVKENQVKLPFITGPIVGQGAYFWTTNGGGGAPPEVFAVAGGSDPVWAEADPMEVQILTGAGTKLGFSDNPGTALHILDLSGAKVAETTINFPVEGVGIFAADFAGNWSVSSDQSGSLVYDGATAMGPSGPQSLDCGHVASIAGAATGSVAISVAAGQILYLDVQASPRVLVGSLGFSAGKVALSNDGSVLAALGPPLRVFDMPGGTTQDVFTVQDPTIDFSLSCGGTTIGPVTQRFVSSGRDVVITRRLANVATGATYLTDAFDILSNFVGGDPPSIALSPDGTLAAICDFVAGPSSTASATTNIFNGGRIVGTAQGYPVGWLDNARLVVNTYAQLDGGPPGDPVYTGSSVCDTQGAVIAPLALPEIDEFSLVGAGGTQIYAPQTNTIYNVSDGSVVWTSLDSPQGVGDVAGNFVVMLNNHQVLVESH